MSRKELFVQQKNVQQSVFQRGKKEEKGALSFFQLLKIFPDLFFVFGAFDEIPGI